MKLYTTGREEKGLSFLLVFCLLQWVVDNISKIVNKFVEISEKKEGLKMKTYSCETHIDHAIDMHVAETEQFPMMDFLSEEEKLSTTCSYCEQSATYVVSSK